MLAGREWSSASAICTGVMCGLRACRRRPELTRQTAGPHVGFEESGVVDQSIGLELPRRRSVPKRPARRRTASVGRWRWLPDATLRCWPANRRMTSSPADEKRREPGPPPAARAGTGSQRAIERVIDLRGLRAIISSRDRDDSYSETFYHSHFTHFLTPVWNGGFPPGWLVVNLTGRFADGTMIQSQISVFLRLFLP